MKTQQSGFTLIELVMVIVIVGILAAVALPKFIDLSSNASTAAVNSVAAAITSASNINYAARMITNTTGSANSSVANTSCATADALLQGGGLPAGYTLGTQGAVTATSGSTFTCQILGSNNTSATAYGIYIP